jgi:hypothetical protein
MNLVIEALNLAFDVRHPLRRLNRISRIHLGPLSQGGGGQQNCIKGEADQGLSHFFSPRQHVRQSADG